MLGLFCSCCGDDEAPYTMMPAEQQTSHSQEALCRDHRIGNENGEQARDVLVTTMQALSKSFTKATKDENQCVEPLRVGLTGTTQWDKESYEESEDESLEKQATIEMSMEKSVAPLSVEQKRIPVAAVTKECIICMDEFTEKDPEVPVLCQCGLNRTYFHYHCLVEWTQHRDLCPVCRGPIFFQEPER